MGSKQAVQVVEVQAEQPKGHASQEVLFIKYPAAQLTQDEPVMQVAHEVPQGTQAFAEML